MLRRGELVSFYIKTDLVERDAHPDQVSEIRRQSQALATPRSDIESYIESLWGTEDNPRYREGRSYQM